MLIRAEVTSLIKLKIWKYLHSKNCHVCLIYLLHCNCYDSYNTDSALSPTIQNTSNSEKWNIAAIPLKSHKNRSYVELVLITQQKRFIDYNFVQKWHEDRQDILPSSGFKWNYLSLNSYSFCVIHSSETVALPSVSHLFLSFVSPCFYSVASGQIIFVYFYLPKRKRLHDW